jgi:hypothetical protein
MEFFVTVFIFIGIMAVTVLVFAAWIIVNVVRGMFGLFGTPRTQQFPQGQNRAAPPNWRPVQGSFSGSPVVGTVQCGVPGCRRINPAGARFCRRCGHAFPQQQQVAAARRAAVL